MAKTAKVQKQTKRAKIPKIKSGKRTTKVTHMSTSSEVVREKRGRVNFAKAFVWPRTAPAYQYIGQAKGLTVEINLEL